MWKLKVAEGGAWLMSVNNHVGRQHWEFDPDAGTPEERAEIEGLRQRYTSNRFANRQSSDAFMRMQMRKEKEPRKAIPEAVKVEKVEDVTEEAVTTTLRRGIDYLCSIQAHDGHWPSELAGPLFLLPQLVMAMHITGGLNTVLPSEHQKEIKRYIYNHQNEDGGWGQHIEGNSTMLGSVFNYVALRLLGEELNDDQNGAVSKGRKWMLDHGGALGIPSWGKFFLTILGLYEWEGCNPLPPEIWLLPRVSPFPGKMTCYSRLIYMPMCYLYGKRFVGKITPLIQQLRQEMYMEPYNQIKWNLARNIVSQVDMYFTPPIFQDMLWRFLYNIGEPIFGIWPFSKLREKALNVVMEHIHYEDFNSRYLTTASITKILCLISCWLEDPNSEAYKYHLARIPDFLWVAEDGMELMGTPGSQIWDATLAIQAILSSNLFEECEETLSKALGFIKASQIMDNPSQNFKKMYRHTSKGSWAFCSQDHGWQVSDCTADSLKVLLLYSQLPKEHGEKIETTRLYDAVDILLSYQSKNGGISCWEPVRTYDWVEKFNPTEVFEECLIEREYVECTSAVIQSLSVFKKVYPEHRRQEIDSCIEKALQYILDEQNTDGSWRARWGICYTYGTWHAVSALTTCGMNYNNSLAIRKACEFLLSKQLIDGGWGESYLSYSNKVYTNKVGITSNLVQTSWALLALIKAGQVGIDSMPTRKAVKLLINSQREDDGDFPQQDATGAFFNTGVLHYTAYRNIFPTWALGEYRKCFPNII